jgi:uncharacterized membrane protein YidH (DUF202 family)
MENWNENEWQGRRKEQVESSLKIGFYSLVVGVLVIIILGLVTTLL